MVWLFVTFHILGALSSVNALLSTRTPQGAIAWIVSLNTLPMVAVPAYWVLGRSRFNGYVRARREIEQSDEADVARAREELLAFRPAGEPFVGERLAELPYLGSNEVELLVDGEATFVSILAGIAGAQESVLVQFYIVRDDDLGNRLKDALVERATAGVKVHFLYDEIGSHSLSRRYLRDLREAGVRIEEFHTTRGSANRFQVNFRNHRKIVVVDAHTAWLGGHNVGDEYLGEDPSIGPWRDTHMRLRGPAVAGVMISFAEDWRWATGETILGEVWRAPRSGEGDATVLVIPTGPADRLETASLMYQQAIQAAEQRIWIATPYFVPDQAVLHSLHLAALRGVDVRILIPESPDNLLVYYSTYALVRPLLESGMRILRYQEGFLHEKVFLVDDRAAGVGTANFDNRSFRLNFEITAVVLDEAFVASVEAMFERDFESSEEMSTSDVDAKGFWFTVASRASYLSSPIQ